MNHARVRRLVVVGCLHLVTNIGFSFFFLTLGTILLGRGVPPGKVALINLLGLIYFGRFLLAPVADRHARYRLWLVVTQIALVGVLLALAPLDPTGDLLAVLGLTVAVLVLSIVHDTALSGLTVRLLEPSDRGLANGIMIASASVSMLIGSGGALLVYAQAGWTATVLSLAAVFDVPLIVLARLPALRPLDEQRTPVVPWRAIVDFLRQPGKAFWTLVVIPVFGVSEWLAAHLQSAMLLAAGWPFDRIAMVQSVSTVAQVVAVLAVGVLITRVSRRRTAVLLGMAGLAVVAALLPLANGVAGVPWTMVTLAALSMVYGAKVTWFSMVSMDLARSASAATDYSVPMSLEGICVTLVGSGALALAGAIGFTWPLVLSMLTLVAGTVTAARFVRPNAVPLIHGTQRSGHA